jgi:hypothetical protein
LSDTLDDTANDSAIDATDPIVRRAHRYFKRRYAWESVARNNWLMDYKFANGDAYNNYQWPVGIYEDRGERPSLTVNETRQHNLHIINEAKQNKAEVKYRPTGGGATAESAEVYEGMYRHIANISNAQMAQGMAISFQVQAGLGWTVIESDYVEASPIPDADAFNQEIYIRGIDDPLSVMVDSDEPDGSGARRGWVFADRPKDEVTEKYPRLAAQLATANAVDGEDAGWIREDHVRECTYYEVTEDKDELLGDDDGTVTFASKVPDELIKEWEAEHEARGSKLKRRPIIRKSVKSHLIIGNFRVESHDLPGTQIPLVPWVGEVTIIGQQMDRKGHTRGLISAQQMENYNWSASVEYGALQSKTPYVTPIAAIGNLHTYWDTANTENHSYLPYNHVDDEGNPIPPPARQQAPLSAPVYMEGVQMARQFMQSASGQYDAEMGRPGNERSGKAIQERQRAGETATYHFIDNQALSIRRQGEIIKEWIPVIYDTERVAKIVNAKGDEEEILINPNSPEAHRAQQIGEAIQRIFNPRIGTYEVVSDVGPDYATQRQEAFNAIVQILTQAPALIDKIGDLLFKVADFPLADEIAERLKPGLDPQAQQAIALLQKQLQAATEKGMNADKLLGEAMQALTEERIKAKNQDNDAVVKAFDADTRRLGVVKDMLKNDPGVMEALRPLIAAVVAETVHQDMQDNLGPIQGHLTEEITQPSPDGATAPSDIPAGLPIRVPNIGAEAAMPGGA